jgi:hypothetical protein
VAKKLNTLFRRLAAVSQMHQQAGFESPTRSWAVKQFLQGLRREVGVAPTRKRPVLVADLQRILAQLPDSLLARRDRALLLGFSGAFRRSELVFGSRLAFERLELLFRTGRLSQVASFPIESVIWDLEKEQDEARREEREPEGTTRITPPR